MPSCPVRLALVAACAASLAVSRLEAQAGTITAARVAAIVGTLADDSMRGRATPSPELEAAAAYVAAAFGRAGLRPAGDSGGYLQRYPVGADATAPNVVGLLPGRDPVLAREYVMVVAHADHVGTGRPRDGDGIWNGADDNASGTAGLLVIADAFAAAPTRPRRSLLFLVVSGEERGLLGSSWYAAHPTVPLDSVVALVNLDMIGRNRPDSVYLNGWGKSEVADEVVRQARAHPALGLAVGPDLEDRPLTPADSDHWPFQRRGIPYAFFYTGPHPDYHGPGDEPSRIDADKAARIACLAYHTVAAIAEAQARPRWDPAARRLNVPDAAR
jgi:Zn-dependent M28 family amino/carboxypeptidase